MGFVSSLYIVNYLESTFLSRMSALSKIRFVSSSVPMLTTVKGNKNALWLVVVGGDGQGVARCECSPEWTPSSVGVLKAGSFIHVGPVQLFL